jgi:hypothetical protein
VPFLEALDRQQRLRSMEKPLLAVVEVADSTIIMQLEPGELFLAVTAAQQVAMVQAVQATRAAAVVVA